MKLAVAGFLLALLAIVSPARAQVGAVNPWACQNYTFVHITSATDTQVIAGVSGKNVYVCDFEFGAAGTASFYFESSSSGTCGSPTQIGGLWTLAVNSVKPAANAFYRGFNAGTGNQLCVHSTGTGGFDLGIFYAQF